MAKLWTSGGKLVQCGNVKLGYDDNCPCFCSCFNSIQPQSWPCGGLLQSYSVSCHFYAVKNTDESIVELFNTSVNAVNNFPICLWFDTINYYDQIYNRTSIMSIGIQWIAGFGWTPTTGEFDIGNPPFYSTDKRNPIGSYSYNYIGYYGPGYYYTYYVSGVVS